MEPSVITGDVKRSRSRANQYGTPGRLTMENGFNSDTQELPFHNNERGRSCVLPGPNDAPQTYEGRVWWSPTLKRLVIRFADANGRQDCLIHNGNWAADAEDLDHDGVPEVTQVHGCTEVGMGYGEILRKDGRAQWGIKFSGSTLAAFIDSLKIPGANDFSLDEKGFARGYNSVRITYSWVD